MGIIIHIYDKAEMENICKHEIGSRIEHLMKYCNIKQYDISRAIDIFEYYSISALVLLCFEPSIIVEVVLFLDFLNSVERRIFLQSKDILNLLLSFLESPTPIHFVIYQRIHYSFPSL